MIQTLTPKCIVLEEINGQMYSAIVATEERLQKYGKKSLLILILHGYVNNNVDE